MDYEKAYKAVLETATQWIKDGCTDKEKICLESVFPELRESESEEERDERNIDTIFNCLYQCCDTGFISGTQRDNALAWLEKQKESLHVSETCKENADSFIDDVIEVRSFRRGIEEGRRQEREKQKELPSQSFNQEQFFAKKDSTPFEKELFLSLRAIKETKPLDEEIWLNVKEQLTPALLSLVQKEQKVDIDKLRRDLYQSGYNDGYQHGKEDAQKEQKPDSYSFNEPYNPDDYEVVMDGNATSLKQKEQNPISQEDFDAAKTRSIVWRAERAEATEYIKRNSKEWYALLSEQYDKGYWKGKAEQKPAEWALPKDFEEAVYKVANFISPFDNQEELRKTSHRFAEQLLSLAKKELDKSAEWSEEDTEMYINVASSLRGYACGLKNEEHKKHIQKGLDWLENRFKSLRPQPKQEWSEEDEMYLSQAIETLEHENYFILADKLKSLRPQYHGDVTMTEAYKMGLEAGKASSWKPSEEQMEALKCAVEDVAKFSKRGGRQVELENEHYYSALHSLYCNLEKLM